MKLGDLLPFESPVVNWGMSAGAGRPWRSASVIVTGERRPGRSSNGVPLRARPSSDSFYLRYVVVFALILIALAMLMPFMPFADRRLVDVATLVLTYVMLGWGLNIVVGLAGLLDLGYVAFYAVGAYTYAMLSVNFGVSFWFACRSPARWRPSSASSSGFPVLRLRGDYLAIVTLGFGEMIRVILINWWWFTGGPNGINKVARPSFFGLDVRTQPAAGSADLHAASSASTISPNQRVFFLYFVILAFALVTNFFTLRICEACRSAAPGRRCARTRRPAARSASIRATPS